MELDKITKINFPEGYETAYASGLTQWDQGQRLEISGLDISDEIVEVHFSLDEYNGKAKRRLGTVIDGVIHTDIPPFILEGPEYCSGTSYNAYAWVYVSDEESAETKRKIELEIEARPKPEDYVTPEELSFLQQLEAYIGRKVDKSGHAPNMYLGTDEEGNVVEKEGSGIYVGSGKMPEGYNIQIDPNGEADEFITKKEFNEAIKNIQVGEVSDEVVAQAIENYLEENPIEVEVPTKTSDLTNDSGFITKNDLPSVPTKTSELTNDSNFVSKNYVDEMLGTYVDEVAELIDENLALLGGGEDE